jgi:hypothetical protein
VQLSKRIHRERVAPEGATRSVVHSASRDLLVPRAEPPRSPDRKAMIEYSNLKDRDELVARARRAK